jgi:hypothetical protein
VYKTRFTKKGRFFLVNFEFKASTLTMTGNPALTTLLTKGIQPNKKEPQLYKHIANTTATNYSYYLPL